MGCFCLNFNYFAATISRLTFKFSYLLLPLLQFYFANIHNSISVTSPNSKDMLHKHKSYKFIVNISFFLPVHSLDWPLGSI